MHFSERTSMGYYQRSMSNPNGIEQFLNEPDLIQLWSAYNLHLVHLISVIPEPTLTRPRTRHNLDEIAFETVAANEATTLAYFIRDYVGHLRHHLDQIFETS